MNKNDWNIYMSNTPVTWLQNVLSVAVLASFKYVLKFLILAKLEFGI